MRVERFARLGLGRHCRLAVTRSSGDQDDEGDVASVGHARAMLTDLAVIAIVIGAATSRDHGATAVAVL